MNRRRSEPRAHASTFIAMIAGAAVAAGGGVLHAYYKNRQVVANREADAIEKRIQQCRHETETMQMRIDQMLNRYAVRDALAQQRSSLKPIGRGVVEEIQTSRSRSVAAATP